MASGQTSSLLIDNVQKILSVYVPNYNHDTLNKLLTLMGVKSHGTITFSDNKSHQADFIRIPNDAPVMHVQEFLNRHWFDEPPSLVISITGGAKEYNMKPRLLRAFRRGLLKVARTTGAWIITGGMNTGIMKLVGEIVQINPDRFRPIPLIGIATWGCVSGRQDLDVHGSNVQYAKSRSNTKGEAPLEPNHTKFIFVDDGSEKKYGREIAFRAKLEQAISGGFFSSKATTNSLNQYASLCGTSSLRPENSGPVPVVLLVVEGGPNTVRTVKEAVVENNIPAVFLEGTGRCCDLFAKAFRLYNEYRTKIEPDDEAPSNIDPNILTKRYDELKIRLREELKEELGAISNSNERPSTADIGTRSIDRTDYFELVYECIHTRRNFLNVISLSSRQSVEPDIDLVILQALLNATSGIGGCKTNMQRKREQLHLALEWNRVDIARNYIMRNEADWNIDLNDLFLLALVRNQTAFVELFLEHDFSLTDLFRDVDKLLTLYNYEKKETGGLIQSSHDALRTLYKERIQPLIGDFFEVDTALAQKDLTLNPESKNEIDDEISGCCGRRRYHSPPGINHRGSVHSEGSTAGSGTIMDADRELFLWSVIAGRRDLAVLFWSRGKNKICAALIATLIYKLHARDENDTSYKQSIEEFEGFAVQMLDKLYQANSKACLKAIIRQIPAYGNATWLELAVAADAKQFIAQRAVQDLFNDIWYGYINERASHITIIFSTFMILCSGFLPYNKQLVTADDKKAIDDTINKPHFFDRQTSKQKRIADRPTDAIQMRLLLPKIKDVDDTSDRTRSAISQYFCNITTFIRAPYVKYLYNLYAHMIFLLLFSYVILCDFFPLYNFPVDTCAPFSNSENREDSISGKDDNEPITTNLWTGNAHNTSKSVSYGFQRRKRPAATEIILVIWVFTLVCEEIRQLFTIEAQSTRNAVIAYFKTFWNKLDVLALVLFFVGFALRYIPTSQCFCAARIVLSVDLSIWFIRSLDMFAAVKRLGPKLVMIGEMQQYLHHVLQVNLVHDLKFFMLMFFVFILAFGVPFYGLVYGVQEFSRHLPRKIINLAYWQIFGELQALDTFEKNYEPNGYAAFILLVAYMTIVSILLVNLLIAMFSNTFDRLQHDTDRIWKFQRYSLICEYLSRPSLPPPFIFFSHVWRLTLSILARCCKSSSIQTKYQEHLDRIRYKISLDDKSAANIEIAEDALGDEVYYNFLKIGRKAFDDTDLDEERVQSPQDNILNKIRALENRIQLMNTQQVHMCEYLEHLMDGLKAMGGDRIKVPQRRRLDPEESFDDTNNNIDQSKQNYRRESLIDDDRPRSNSNPDEQQSQMINLFSSRRH
ncbi:unnamed protein product [Rotaria sordida]|uniref:Uncharacterized protein n=1 Tax=Rotaria sordida TaxID=392033 RepID=A0A813ZVC3_9BILA|nr:unnamed protein product [Rotaria sordida]